MEKALKIGTILGVLKWLFVVLLLSIISVLIIQGHNMICNCSPVSFCELILSWEFLKYLLIACFSLLTLYVAEKELQKQTDVACITALAELRKQLTSERNRNVHFALSPKEEQETMLKKQKTDEKEKEADEKVKEENKIMQTEKILKIDVLNYLGTLELGVLMVKKDLIDMKTFYSQFGYRIENIFEEENSDFHVSVRKHINGGKLYYKEILWGREKICKKHLK